MIIFWKKRKNSIEIVTLNWIEYLENLGIRYSNDLKAVVIVDKDTFEPIGTADLFKLVMADIRNFPRHLDGSIKNTDLMLFIIHNREKYLSYDKALKFLKKI